MRSTARCCSGLSRTACEASRTLSRSALTWPSCSSAARRWAKTRSSAAPARPRSSSRDMPRRSGFARWNCSSAADDQATQPVVALGVDVPVAFDGQHPAAGLELARICAKLVRAERDTRPASALTRAPAAPTWRTCSSTISSGVPRSSSVRCASRAGALRRLKRGGATSSSGAAADGHDRRVGADDVAVTRYGDQRGLQTEAGEGPLARAQARYGPAAAREP